MGGSFLLGEGRHDDKWSLLDDLGQVCRQERTPLEARLGGSERSAKRHDAARHGWRSHMAFDVRCRCHFPSNPRHVTVLLNSVLPVKPEPGQDGASESPHLVRRSMGTLLSILESLPERMPATSVRLVVFDPDQQRELFRQDDFKVDEIHRIAHTADGIDQWAVGHSAIRTRWEPEISSPTLRTRRFGQRSPPDDVVFLGLPWGGAKNYPHLPSRLAREIAAVLLSGIPTL